MSWYKPELFLHVIMMFVKVMETGDCGALSPTEGAV
jgi:hypothetical protein